jgi:hypothetical protein
LRAWFDSSCPDPLLAKKLAGMLLVTASPFHFENPRRVEAMTSQGLTMMGLV